MALAVWIGAATFRVCVLPPALPAAEAGRIHASLVRLLAACLLVLCATSVVLLALRVAVMSGEPVLRGVSMAPQVILHTHYGPVWAIRPVALAGDGLRIPKPCASPAAPVASGRRAIYGPIDRIETAARRPHPTSMTARWSDPHRLPGPQACCDPGYVRAVNPASSR